MKKQTHNISDPVEKQHYKKKYLERKLQEREANKEIKVYDETTTNIDTSQSLYMQKAQTVDAKG
jgi:hypothetical protein